MATNVAFQMPLSVYRGLLSSLQRWDILAGTIMASEVLRAAAIVVAFSLGFGLISLAGISVTASLGATAASIIFARRLYPVSIDRHLFQSQMLPQLMNYSLSTLMYSSSQIILLQSGKTLVGLLYGPAAVTVFAIPFMVLIMMSQMVQQAAQPLRPATTVLDSEGQSAEIGRMYVSATKYALMVAIPSSLLFMLWGERLLKAWVGADFSSQSAAVLFVMTIPQMLRAVNNIGFFVLSGLGQHRFFGQITLAESILGVVVAYLLAVPLGFGLLGVALGIAVVELIISGFVVPLHVFRQLGCDIAELGRTVFQALTSAIPFALYCALVSTFSNGHSRLELFLVLGMAALPLAAGVWFLGLTREERGRFKSYFYPTRGGTVLEP
jgi:O-antigen/teichoic acid export membrane protein